ncbi:MAG: hypothetical protein ACI4EI_03580 [Muricoprocola sp.]
MDLDALISEICRRVQERVAACEAEPEVEGNCIGIVGAEEKPVLGIISENHGDICHTIYESKSLAEYYQMKCALLDDAWDVENWEGVIAYTLTNEALGKIVNGIFDTPYVKAFGKALLCGKKIYVPQEEVELYKYKETAPKGYYQKLEENLKFLKENGVEILPNDQIVPAILGSECCQSKAEPEESAATVVEKDLTFTRKVLSERDMIMANEGKVTRILVTRKTIITDLAKDYAKKYHMVIEKTDC